MHNLLDKECKILSQQKKKSHFDTDAGFWNLDSSDLQDKFCKGEIQSKKNGRYHKTSIHC